MALFFAKRKTRMGIGSNRCFFTRNHEIRKACQTYGRLQIPLSFVVEWRLIFEMMQDRRWDDAGYWMRDQKGLRVACCVGRVPADSVTTADKEWERLTRRRGARGEGKGKMTVSGGGTFTREWQA